MPQSYGRGSRRGRNAKDLTEQEGQADRGCKWSCSISQRTQNWRLWTQTPGGLACGWAPFLTQQNHQHPSIRCSNPPHRPGSIALDDFWFSKPSSRHSELLPWHSTRQLSSPALTVSNLPQHPTTASLVDLEILHDTNLNASPSILTASFAPHRPDQSLVLVFRTCRPLLCLSRIDEAV